MFTIATVDILVGSKWEIDYILVVELLGSDVPRKIYIARKPRLNPKHHKMFQHYINFLN